MDLNSTLPLERRPFSAPPAATFGVTRLGAESPAASDDYRRDPAYYSFYHSNRTLNPRLAPPIIEAGGLASYPFHSSFMSGGPISSYMGGTAQIYGMAEVMAETRRPRQDSTIVPGDNTYNTTSDSMRSLAIGAEAVSLAALDGRGDKPLSDPLASAEESVRSALSSLNLEGSAHPHPYAQSRSGTPGETVFHSRDGVPLQADAMYQHRDAMAPLPPSGGSWSDLSVPEGGGYYGKTPTPPPPVPYSEYESYAYTAPSYPGHDSYVPGGGRGYPPARTYGAPPPGSGYPPSYYHHQQPHQHPHQQPRYAEFHGGESRYVAPAYDPMNRMDMRGGVPMHPGARYDRRAGPGMHRQMPADGRFAHPRPYGIEDDRAGRGTSRGGRRGGAVGYGERSVPKGVASPVLEAFLHGRFVITHITQIAGSMAEFARDSRGHLVLLDALNKGSSEEQAAIFAELVPHALELMTDSHGSAVIQCMLERGSPSDRMAIAAAFKDQVVNLSQHHFGCRVVQKALECMPLSEKIQIARELDGHVMKCVQDQNGNHVVQKCVEQIKGEGVDFLLSAFAGSIAKLSIHPYGCRVVQRIIEHCSPDQVATVFAEVLPELDTLLQHQYGNYVIQCVLEHGKPEQKSIVVDCILGRVLTYARHKFASNVVERCMEYGSARQKAALVDEILSPTLVIVERDPERKLPDEYSTNITPLQVLLADQFGNYVAQKLLDIADDRQRAVMVELLRGYAPTLRKYQHGRHMLARMEKVAGKMLLHPSTQSPTGPGSSVHSAGDSRTSPATVMVPAVRAAPGSTPPPGFISASTPSPVYGMGPPVFSPQYSRYQ